MQLETLRSATEQNDIVVRYSWFMQVLLGLDQLGNALAGGHHDSTVSARIGYHLYNPNGARGMYWSFLEFVVNLTFSPVDGPHHCRMAYCSDRNEDFREGGFLAKVVLVVLVLVTCLVLILPILAIGLFQAAGTSYYLSNGQRIPKKDVYRLIEICVSEDDPCFYLKKLR